MISMIQSAISLLNIKDVWNLGYQIIFLIRENDIVKNRKAVFIVTWNSIEKIGLSIITQHFPFLQS